MSGALALAVSPTDVTHLLLGTDSGLLRSRNGGLDWEVEAPGVLVGSVFAVAFDADGRRALAATAAGLYRTDEGSGWRAIPAPDGAAPARALVPAGADRVYLLGWSRLYRSADWGSAWDAVELGSPEPATALVAEPVPPGALYALAGGRVWMGDPGGLVWAPRGCGPDAAAGRPPVEALALDPREPRRLWAVAGSRLHRSDDGGASWRAVGQPLPDPGVVTRNLAAGGAAVTLATDRGLYRSVDGGERWEALTDNLPGHLEAWPLVRDPRDPSTLYAGFALVPYAEQWGQARDGRASLRRLSPASLAGGFAFLVLLGAAAGLALRRLARAPAPPGAAGAGRPEGRRS